MDKDAITLIGSPPCLLLWLENHRFDVWVCEITARKLDLAFTWCHQEEYIFDEVWNNIVPNGGRVAVVCRLLLFILPVVQCNLFCLACSRKVNILYAWNWNYYTDAAPLLFCWHPNTNLYVLFLYLLQIQALPAQDGHADNSLWVRALQVVDVRI